MRIKEFQLERFFGKHEFTAKYLMSSSDCDGFSLDYVLSQASTSELELWNKMSFGYTESQGDPILREAILQYYQQDSIDNIIVASPGELNFVAMNVLLTAEDHVITISPSYQSLHEVVNSIGCSHSFWKPSENGWEFNPDELEDLVQKNTKLIIINFPHNPTGSYLSPEQQHRVINFARKHNLYVFSDEMYHKLVLDGTEELTPLCDLYEKGISLWGTSKTLGLAGLRTGWLVSQDQDFLKKVLIFKDYLSICGARPNEVLSIIALNHLEQFLQPNLIKIEKNIARFKEFASTHDIVSRFDPPRAGSIAFVKLNIEKPTIDFSEKLVEKTGIMTVPAEMFGYAGKFIRIGFGRENLAETLEVFSDYLEKSNEKAVT